MLAGEGEVGLCAEVGEEGVAEQVALAQFLREGGLVAEAQAVAEGVEEQEERLEEECSDEEVRKRRKRRERSCFRTDTLLGIYI